jgi:hypothetical protein
MTMTRTSIALLGIALAATAVAQAPAKVDLAAATGFSWRAPAAPLPADGEAALQRLRAEVGEVLQANGYKPAGGGTPDLLVAVHRSYRDLERMPNRQSTLVVDLIHAASGTLIWRSFDSEFSTASLRAARFAGVSTYDFKIIPTKPGEQPAYTRTDRQIRATIEAALLFRGLDVQPEGAGAPVEVVYRLVGRGAEVKGPLTAELIVEVFAAGTNDLLWRGTSTGPVVKPDKIEDAIIDRIVDMWATFPKGEAIKR